MKRSGLSLSEVIIALAIAVMVMVPVTSIFSTSGQQVQKSRNFSFCGSTCQTNFAAPDGHSGCDDILEVPFPANLYMMPRTTAFSAH